MEDNIKLQMCFFAIVTRNCVAIATHLKLAVGYIWRILATNQKLQHTHCHNSYYI